MSSSNLPTVTPNITNCLNRALYFYYNSIDLLQWRYYYGNAYDNYFNTTLFIANTTNMLMFCYDSAQTWYNYYNADYILFGGPSNFAVAFF